MKPIYNSEECIVKSNKKKRKEIHVNSQNNLKHMNP